MMKRCIYIITYILLHITDGSCSNVLLTDTHVWVADALVTGVLWSRVNGASSMFITDDVTRKMAGLDWSAEMSDHSSDKNNYLKIHTMMNHGYFTSNQHNFLCCTHLSQFCFLFLSPLSPCGYEHCHTTQTLYYIIWTVINENEEY